MPMGGKDGDKRMGLIKYETGSNIDGTSTETGSATNGGKDERRGGG